MKSFVLTIGTFAWLSSIGINATLMAADKSDHHSSASYTETKHPIVMVPGAFAFDNVLGIIDYWYGITDAMRAQGAEVYVTNLSSSNLLVARGEELLEDVRRIRAITGASKVNLIAHSQGATAARYVANVMPEWVASVSCIHCMNEGTPFADNLYAFVNRNRFLKGIINFTLSTVFTALEFLSGPGHDGDYKSPNRGLQIAENLVIAAGRESHKHFNQMFPAGLSSLTCAEQKDGFDYQGVGGENYVNGTYYFSLGGTTAVTNRLDPIDNLLVPVVKMFYPGRPIWDGLVPSCGHPLGKLIEGRYPTSHFDAINQAFGLVESGIDVPSLYVMHANRLKIAGL
ncbi:MAG: esterase/lipase family protein [Oligoflexus sp.]